ncbi:MAG TPA: translesion error-prone DNA polymerase V autoproteolytic subunit [Rhodothermales bacterium]|nr:translesion error-prone DNA polymerase V autoproteolytic subunit [Rhodothermales bacterium]
MPRMYHICNPQSATIQAIYQLVPGEPCPVPLIITKVQAGFPSPALDYIEEVLDLNVLLIKNPPSTFMMRVAGHSMKDAGIYDGDLLVVDRAIEAAHDDVVIALLDRELTVKALYRRGGHIGLIAANEAYPNIRMKEGMELEIWGIVTHVIRSLR